MNTKHLSWMLATLLIAVLSINITACKEDDKELSPEEQDKQATVQNLIDMTFWGVAGQLANGCEQVDDWQSARLEANIGQPSQQSDATRLVLVNDADAALERFSALIGTQLPDYTVSYEWTLDGAGSLTYRKQTDGTAWATVDVDLKQFPGLKRIVYCAPEQQGLNGDFKGTAYYRFGDVIRKKNDDGNWDYWICVRPMFGKEGKQDMHWVTLSDFPEKNIAKYTASTNDTYYMPTKLSGAYSKIHWQNAAEMLFAILHPVDWSDNLTNNAKLAFFNDFSRNSKAYHNQYFWQRVQKAWEKYDLFNQLLHFDYNTLSNDMKSIRFIYYGYKWKWTWGWDMTLWAQEYSGMDNNFHTFKALEKTENVKNKPFNVHEYGKYGEHPEGYQPFPRFTYPCRYATGKELAGFTPNEYNTIASTKNGIEEVYVYNKEYEVEFGPLNEPEVATKNMVDGGDVGNLEYGFFTPGTIISDSQGARWLCYLSWANLGEGAIGGGHKAHFISFDNIISKGEDVDNKAYDASANYGFFAQKLVPEKEVPKLAYQLWSFAFVGSSDSPENEVRTKVKEKLGVNLRDFFTRRDTLFDSGKSVGKANIDATNFLYEPTGGRVAGTQPYMRYVMDGTHVGNNRVDLPSKDQYWMHRFFKKASNMNDQRPLNLVDLFKVYKRLVNDTIKADQWSHCKRNGIDYRDPDFMNGDCYDGLVYSSEHFGYNTITGSWGNTITGHGFTRPKYVSAYWEPVIIVRYMEIEDTKQTFQDTYNGEKFTLVYDPAEPFKLVFRTTNWGNLNSSIGNTWMDYVPYNMITE